MKQSNALWPDDVYSGMYGDHISTDTHRDEEAAKAVCRALEREGFGGMRKAFPLKTWVSDVQQPPQLPSDPMITCVKCGFKSSMTNNFDVIGEEDICLDCAGYAPPTCGNMGDF